ncbi:hypothetical protein C8A01DRAFT_41017 [Parachaetomium inaequale]|uniref:Uncharacterized protein n=1 Tax=Parachaetomium inaequale TaxID=2588326 RepID=A0AAN6PAP4_9PEZI|nr:hypothetical protein C8A01DRAFT_41017 [Parachaetomium inaequale]
MRSSNESPSLERSDADNVNMAPLPIGSIANKNGASGSESGVTLTENSLLNGPGHENHGRPTSIHTDHYDADDEREDSNNIFDEDDDSFDDWGLPYPRRDPMASSTPEASSSPLAGGTRTLGGFILQSAPGTQDHCPIACRSRHDAGGHDVRPVSGVPRIILLPRIDTAEQARKSDDALARDAPADGHSTGGAGSESDGGADDDDQDSQADDDQPESEDPALGGSHTEAPATSLGAPATKDGPLSGPSLFTTDTSIPLAASGPESSDPPLGAFRFTPARHPPQADLINTGTDTDTGPAPASPASSSGISQSSLRVWLNMSPPASTSGPLSPFGIQDLDPTILYPLSYLLPDAITHNNTFYDDDSVYDDAPPDHGLMWRPPVWRGHTHAQVTDAIWLVEQELDWLDERSWRELLIGEDEFSDSDADVQGWGAYPEGYGYGEGEGYYDEWYRADFGNTEAETEEESETGESEVELWCGWDSGDDEVVGWDEVEEEQDEDEDEVVEEEEEGDEVRWVGVGGWVYFGV